MRVEWSENDVFTDEEMALIQRARRALYDIGFNCRGRTSKGYNFMYDISAVIEPKTRTEPMQVNFKATNRNISGVCMIGPQRDLNEKLFQNGKNEITIEFHKEIATAVNEFIHSMETA